MQIKPVMIGGFPVYSPDIAFWASKLALHNFFHEASTVLTKPKYRNEPNSAEAYCKSVFENHEAAVRPAWVMNRSEVMHAILWEFARVEGDFSSFLSFISDQFTDDCEFLPVSHVGERLFACGMTVAQCRKQFERGHDVSITSPGNNIYGRTLKRLLTNPSVEPILNAHRLLHFSSELPFVSYRNTVSLIGDDTLACAQNPEGGMVYFQPKATCLEMAGYLNAVRVDLRSFHVVILCIGTFDALQLDPAEQAVSLESLYQAIRPIINEPGVVLLVNTGIGFSDAPEVAPYFRWFQRTLRDWMEMDVGAVSNVHYCDWSGPDARNPFLDEKRAAMSYFLTDDNFPNGIGLRRMWRRWIDVYPMLGNVDVRFRDSSACS